MNDRNETKGAWQQGLGRWMLSVETRYGYAVAHVWESGRWEVARGGTAIACGVAWQGMEEAQRRAENWIHNLKEMERP